jgi:hypothetical protein
MAGSSRHRELRLEADLAVASLRKALDAFARLDTNLACRS